MSEYKKLVSNEEFFNILFDPEREREAYEKTMKAIALEQGFNEGHAEGLAKGHAEGLAEGLAEGKKKEAIEIAKEMLKESISDEQISKITKLSIEEIEKLKEEK